MTKSTALATTEDVGGRPLSEVVSEGANLAPEVWREARIAAARMLLPEEFRDAGSMIAFLARAQRSGLDPFLGELWAWKNERGKLQFMTARDGWLRLAREDERIKGVEHGLVYEGDTFDMTREGGFVEIRHHGGIKKNPMAVMAYAVCHFEDGTSGEPERRTFEDYKHLMGKSNWKNDPNGMLLTRAVANAIKFSSPKAAGIGSPADMGEMLSEGEGVAGQVLEGMTERKTDELRARLEAAKAPGEVRDETPIETASEEVTEPPQEPEDLPFPCDECDRSFSTQQGRSSHKRIHKREQREAEKAAAAEEPDPDFHLSDIDSKLEDYIAKVDEDDPTKLVVVDPDGVEADYKFDTLDECVEYAGLHLAKLEAEALEAPADGYSTARPPSEDDRAPTTPPEGGTPEKAAQEPAAPIRISQVYAAAEQHEVTEKQVEELVNGERWNHLFEDYRREGAERINIFDLDQDGRDDLMKIIQGELA